MISETWTLIVGHDSFWKCRDCKAIVIGWYDGDAPAPCEVCALKERVARLEDMHTGALVADMDRMADALVDEWTGRRKP